MTFDEHTVDVPLEETHILSQIITQWDPKVTRFSLLLLARDAGLNLKVNPKDKGNTDLESGSEQPHQSPRKAKKNK